jgi:hypothetical protein
MAVRGTACGPGEDGVPGPLRARGDEGCSQVGTDRPFLRIEARPKSHRERSKRAGFHTLKDLPSRPTCFGDASEPILVAKNEGGLTLTGANGCRQPGRAFSWFGDLALVTRHDAVTTLRPGGAVMREASTPSAPDIERSARASRHQGEVKRPPLLFIGADESSRRSALFVTAQ